MKKEQGLEIIYEDSIGKPQVSVFALEKLISVDSVPAVIGDLSSLVTLAMGTCSKKV